ncbi:MAG: hypothetical protein ACFFED_07950 [Candidatus Thorarchaeota archaeon]
MSSEDFGIGTLSERSLHASLKEWYRRPEDELEVQVEGYVIDIVREGLLIEIQTRNFGALKDKLMALIPNHRIRLVHPVPRVRWVVREGLDGTEISRRKSPKTSNVLAVFEELVSIPTILVHHNFELEVLEVFEEQVMQKDGKGSWKRKGWSVVDRRLIDVAERHLFTTPQDLVGLLPPDLVVPFTSTELAMALGCTRRIAQKITYCLRKMKILRTRGKRNRAMLHVFQ